MLGDHQLAQDLMQESLIKAYVAWPRLRDVTKAEAYTRRIIVTTSISWRRRRGVQERPTESLPDSATPDQTERLGAEEDLWADLWLLPPRQCAAVVLRFCEDLSEARTAGPMECSVGNQAADVAGAGQAARSDEPAADPSRTASSDELASPLFEWLDNNTVALFGGSHGDIVTCRLSSGRCDLRVRGRNDDGRRIVPNFPLPG